MVKCPICEDTPYGQVTKVLRVFDVTKCVKPLSGLATLRSKSSRSTNQSCPFGRLSTHSVQVAKWFDALCHSGPYLEGRCTRSVCCRGRRTRSSATTPSGTCSCSPPPRASSPWPTSRWQAATGSRELHGARADICLHNACTAWYMCQTGSGGSGWLDAHHVSALGLDER